MPGPGPTNNPGITWRFQAGGQFASSPVVDRGVVFAISGDGVVHALTLDTGDERWSAKLGAQAEASPLLVGGDLVAADDAGIVHALALADGTPQWTFKADGAVTGSPAADGDGIVVATQAGSVYMIDPASGRPRWQTDAGGRVSKSVAILDGVAYVGTDGALIGIDLTDGTILWRNDLVTDGLVGTPSVSGGLVYAAVGIDGKDPAAHGVIAAETTTGKVRWRYDSPSKEQVYTPAVVGDQAFVVGHDRLVVCLDAATGAVEWSSAQPSEVEALPVVSHGMVFVVGNGGPVSALDAGTGSTSWSVPVRGVPFGPSVVDGYLLVGTDLGILYAIRGAG